MHEPYVADPAEPAPPRRLARLAPALWTLVIVLLVTAGTTALLQGWGEEDPALQAPTEAEQGPAP